MSGRGTLLQSRQRQQRLAQAVAYAILTLGAVMILIPFVFMLSTSLKDKDRIFTRSIEWIPRKQIRVEVSGKTVKLFRFAKSLGDIYAVPVEELPRDRVRVAVLTRRPAETVDPRFLRTTRVVDWNELEPATQVAFIWSNYREALTPPNFRFLLYLRNPLAITVLALVGQVLSCTLVAFGFARLRFPGRGFLFIVLLSTMMLPAQVTMVPLFKLFVSLGWYDTFLPLTVPAYFATSAFFVFLLRQYFMGIPIEMDEAARIDGASSWGVFSRVLLPQVKPAVATVAIFSFMGHWNDFLGPLIYLGNPDLRTLALGLYAFQGEHSVDLQLLMAAASVVMLPLLALFAVAQRYFIQGVVISGVKG